ncbi:MAG: TonB-dependent receptor [Bacteroidia bacterium]|nr:TonB-dependent receptor [Bacteroidia bacterium]
MNKPVLTFLFTLFTFAAVAQNGIVSGFVKDKANGEKLIGVAISVDGVAKEVTGLEGDFKLTLREGPHVLKFSYMGYENLEEKVNVKNKELLNLTIEMVGRKSQLKMVVISSSQYEKDLARENVSVEVLTKAQIKNTNSIDLSETVNRVAGVQVQDGQVSIRGGSSYSYGVGSRTAVMVDGLTIASADLGMNQWSFAPIENAEQVEVIKGASSVVYGSSALNGVINMRTAWPKSEPETEITAFTQVFGAPEIDSMRWWPEGSAPSTSGISFSDKRKIGILDLVSGGNLYITNSYLDQGNSVRGRLDMKTRINSKKKPGLQYGLDFNWQRENNGLFFLSHNLDDSAYVASSWSDNRYMQTYIDPHLTYSGTNGAKHTLRFRYLNVFRWGNGDDPNANSHSINGDYQFQKKFKEKAILTCGLPLSAGFSRSNLYPGLRINYFGAVYTQGEYFVGKRFSATAGVRYEINGVDTMVQWGIPVFRSGINYQIAKFTFLRASYGQSYRQPTIGERYVDASFSILKIVPNPNLDVEKGWSAEIGLKQGFRIGNFNGLLDAALFWQEYDKFVEYRFDLYTYKGSQGQDTTSFGLKPFNVAGARIAGYEIGLMGEGNIGEFKIRVMGGYTYTFPADLDSNSNIRSAKNYIKDFFKYATKRIDSTYAYNNILQFRNRHLVRGDIEITYKKLSIGYTIYYGSFPEKIPAIFSLVDDFLNYNYNEYQRKHIKGDLVMDIRAGFDITSKIRLGFVCKNLTNHTYSTRPGIMEAPRNFTLQVRYKI